MAKSLIPLGVFLKSLRQKSGLTVEKVAAAVGCTVTVVYKWEECVSIPSTSNMRKIVKLYNLTPKELKSSVVHEHIDGFFVF
jgi:transcriptional regulator with XRE-family HTH domain